MAEALAIITLTQRSHCDKPGVPYIGVEQDLAALRRLDPNWISRYSLQRNELASFAYWDEYHEANGLFPWINPDFVTLPEPPPNYIPHSKRHPSEKGLTWNDANLYDSNDRFQHYIKLKDPQSTPAGPIRPRTIESPPLHTGDINTEDLKVCRTRFTGQHFFNDKSAKITCRNRRTRRAPSPDQPRLLMDENNDSRVNQNASSDYRPDPYSEESNSPSSSFVHERYNNTFQDAEVVNSSIDPLAKSYGSQLTTAGEAVGSSSELPVVDPDRREAIPALKIYKLKGHIVVLLILALLTLLIFMRRMLMIWRNRRSQQNLQILLSDLADSDKKRLKLKPEKLNVCNSLRELDVQQSVNRCHRYISYISWQRINRSYCLIILYGIGFAWRVRKMAGRLRSYLKRWRLERTCTESTIMNKQENRKKIWNKSTQLEIMCNSDTLRRLQSGQQDDRQRRKVNYCAVETLNVHICQVSRPVYGVVSGDKIEMSRTDSASNIKSPFLSPVSMTSTTILPDEISSELQFQSSESSPISHDLFSRDRCVTAKERTPPSVIIDEDPPPGFELSSKGLFTGPIRENPFDRVVKEPVLGTLLYRLIVGQDLSPSEVQLLLRIGEMDAN